MADQRLIELEGITKTYRQADREIEVLKGISLSIEREIPLRTSIF